MNGVFPKLMEIEIELKLLVAPDAALLLPQLVKEFIADNVNSSVETQTVQLANTYYDTDDKVLRRHDIGLRTRSTDGIWEQTIKTAGKVVGGLHQRPEYNIPIATNQPDMALFSSTILPEQMSAIELQSALAPLFTTDFKRQIWRITKGDCRFEMVFDSGAISSGDKQLPLCEVELELLEGQVGGLFEFAKQMIHFLCQRHGTEESINVIRIGSQSKAARGYQLLSGEVLKEKAYLAQVPLIQNDTLESAFVKTVEYGLAFMQYHEQCFINNPSLLALRRFTDGVALIRHGMWLFSMIVAPDEVKHFRSQIKWILQSFDWVEHGRQLKALRSKTGKYRKKLDLNTALSQLVDEQASKEPSLDRISQFFSLPRYNQIVLEISRWLVEKGWRKTPQLDLTHSIAGAEGAEGALQGVAGDLLNNSWQSLLTVMPRRQQLTIDDYISQHQQLKRSLMTGCSLGALYPEDVRNDFRMPWLDLSRGIDELKTLHLLQTLALQVDSDESRATLNWLEQQIESLLLAMEQTRKSAIKMRPYWGS